MTDRKAIVAEAKALGINTYHMTNEDIAEAIVAATAQGAEREPRPTERADTGRNERIPLGTARLKMAHETREGYHRHYMNDRANRIHDAERAGYTFVTKTDNDGRDEKVSRVVGSHSDGSPMTAYLMEIRQEFYDEDQAAKQAVVDEIDAAIMRRGEPNDDEARDRAGFYTPSEGSSMSRVTT